MYMAFCLHVCLFSTCMQCPQWSEEGSLELDLQPVISHHVHGRTHTRVLWKSSQGSFNYRASSLAPRT